MDHISLGEGLNIYQINIEGASASKSEYLSRKAYDHKADVIAVQETHINRGEEYHMRSARWRQGYNPDLCFVSRDRNDRPLPVTRKVLEDFPRSQHRPILLRTGTKIFFAQSKQKPRWNFTKADWVHFALRVDAAIRFVPCELKNYDRFLGIFKSAAKRCIPRGFRKRYIPGWKNFSSS